MKVSAQVRGGRDYDAALDALYHRVERSTYRAVAEGVHLVERVGKRKLRTYTHPEGTPTTSPPGQPPAMVTGNLIRSWRSTPARAGRKPNTVVARTGPTAVYARAQDRGATIHNAFGVPGLTVTLPPRPYVEPAATDAIPGIRRIFVRRWTEAILA